MNIMGLDISSTCTGFVIGNDKKEIIEANYIELESITSSGKHQNIFIKVDYLLEILLKKIKKYNIKLIIIESPLDIATGTNINSAILLNRLNYCFVYTLYRLGYNIRYVPSQTARKNFLKDEYKLWLKENKGDDKKEFIVERVKKYIQHLVLFEKRPRATTKHKEYLYDISDSYIIFMSYFDT